MLIRLVAMGESEWHIYNIIWIVKRQINIMGSVVIHKQKMNNITGWSGWSK